MLVVDSVDKVVVYRQNSRVILLTDNDRQSVTTFVSYPAHRQWQTVYYHVCELSCSQTMTDCLLPHLWVILLTDNDRLSITAFVSYPAHRQWQTVCYHVCELSCSQTMTDCLLPRLWVILLTDNDRQNKWPHYSANNMIFCITRLSLTSTDIQ